MYRLQWSWDPEDVSLLERCLHFRGCSFKGPEDVPSTHLSRADSISLVNGWTLSVSDDIIPCSTALRS